MRARTFVTVALLGTTMLLVAPPASDTRPTRTTGDLQTLAAKAKAPDCGGLRPPKPGGGRYTCSFADDFNGSRLNPAKWVVGETSTSGFTSGDAKDCYVNNGNHVSVGDGVLKLTARLQASEFTCGSPYGNFRTNRTAGSVVSWDNFSQAYGRFEFRARFPAVDVQGVHSALWLYPQRHTYGRWPRSGEVDVAEWFSGSADHVYPSVHYQGETVMESTGLDCDVPTANSKYHKYSVEWTPTVMKFRYDKRLCFQHSWTPRWPLTGAQPFDQPFVVALTQAFGGAWNAVTPATPSPVTMSVDWVRVWR